MTLATTTLHFPLAGRTAHTEESEPVRGTAKAGAPQRKGNDCPRAEFQPPTPDLTWMGDSAALQEKDTLAAERFNLPDFETSGGPNVFQQSFCDGFVCGSNRDFHGVLLRSKMESPVGVFAVMS